jgi:hypothetical protein
LIESTAIKKADHDNLLLFIITCRKVICASKTHKLFVEELLLLTKATYNPATGKMDTGLRLKPCSFQVKLGFHP